MQSWNVYTNSDISQVVETQGKRQWRISVVARLNASCQILPIYLWRILLDISVLFSCMLLGFWKP